VQKVTGLLATVKLNYVADNKSDFTRCSEQTCRQATVRPSVAERLAGYYSVTKPGATRLAAPAWYIGDTM